MVAMDKDSTVRRWLDETSQAQGLQSKIVAEVNQLDSLGQLVSMGIGVGIVPSLCADQMTQMGLHMQKISGEILRQPVGVVTKNQSPLSAAGKGTVELLKDSLS